MRAMAAKLSAPRERGSAHCVPSAPHDPIVCPARAGIGPLGRLPSRPPPCLPRASGDRPEEHTTVKVFYSSAPRERGSARPAPRRRDERRVCPARAGIGPEERGSFRRCRGLPRASGDRPWQAIGIPPEDASAPRERGSAGVRHRRQVAGRVCPARAGIGLLPAVVSSSLERLPRASGDRPLGALPDRSRRASAPRERGSAHSRPPRPARGLVCPARAGIGPTFTSSEPRPKRLPRASGDRPPEPDMTGVDFWSAPRERGSAFRAGLDDRPPDVCPARAGIGPRRREDQPRRSSLPRASGDRPPVCWMKHGAEASAPRERGSALNEGPLERDISVCPARAGIGPFGPDRHSALDRLPRASGDRPIRAHVGPEVVASAPRERGSALGPRRQGEGAAVCPARAGIGPGRHGSGHRRPSLPRASGDRPRLGFPVRRLSQSAPRERGSARRSGVSGTRRAVCPARAGIGPSRRAPRACPPGLPRASGDRPCMRMRCGGRGRSAPRERGSAGRATDVHDQAPVCPARAGIGP